MFTPRIGIVNSYNEEATKQIVELQRRLYTVGAQVVLLSPKSVNPEEPEDLDMIIIPDKVGFYPGMDGFIDKCLPISNYPMCPQVELWRIHDLPVYMEVMNSTLVGIGESRTILWDAAEYGDLSFDGTEACCVNPNYSKKEFEVLEKNDINVIVEFERNDVVGVVNVYSKLLTKKIREVLEISKKVNKTYSKQEAPIPRKPK